MIEITVRIPKHSPGRYQAWLGARKLCVSKEPLLSSARILLREGADPAARLGMRWEGSNHIALSGVIGELAKWTVRETDHEGPTFVAWRAPPSQRLRPPVRSNGPAATQPADLS